MLESFNPSVVNLLMLLLAAFIAGYIDTLVGGGGLITIPALLAAGLPPIYALGTNKLQAVAGSGTASFTVLRSDRLAFGDVKWLMVAAFLGSLIGATLVQFFDSRVLSIVIPGVIIIIAVYFIMSPKQSISEREPRISKTTYGASAVPAVGFYDGMFGPGTGSFFAWAGVSLRGQQIVQSTLTAKTLNFATNIAALLVFIGFGKIAWATGLLMMLGQVFGARLGARSLLTINPEILRYLVIALCFIILAWWSIR